MTAFTVDFRKHSGPTAVDDMAAQISHWLWKLPTGLQATWILCLSTLPPDSGTLISKWNATITFIWIEDFGSLSNSPVLFLLSSSKMLLTMFLFQKWLGSPFPEDVWAWWLLSTDSSFSSLLVKLSQVFESALQYSQAWGHPCGLCTFSYPISSFQLTLHLICFDTALLEQQPLSVMTLCDLPSLWRVSMIVPLDHCQVSSVLHYCGFKQKEIPTIYTVWMVIYWNSNSNFLRYWFFYFH